MSKDLTLHNLVDKHKGAIFDIVGSGETALEYRPTPKVVSIGLNRGCLLAPLIGLKNPIFDYEIIYDRAVLRMDWYTPGMASEGVIIESGVVRAANQDKLSKVENKIWLTVPQGKEMPDVITPDKLYRMGTSVALAMQCACLMGASEIHLYGTTYTEGEESFKYFTGDTAPKSYKYSQRDTEAVIKKLMSQFGVKILAKKPNYFVSKKLIGEL